MSPYTSPAEADQEHRRLVLLHWLSLPLVLGIIGAGGYRSFILEGPSNRMDIVVITAAGKSLLCLIYILCATHVSCMKSIYSARAVLVIGVIDTLFWAAATGLTAYGMMKIPSSGTRETLNYALIGMLVAIVVFLLSLPVLYLAFRQDRHARTVKLDGDWDEVEMLRSQDRHVRRK